MDYVQLHAYLREREILAGDSERYEGELEDAHFAANGPRVIVVEG